VLVEAIIAPRRTDRRRVRAERGRRAGLRGPLPSAGALLDGLLVWAVAALAAWTVLYHLALLTPVDGAALWWVWAVSAAVVAVLVVRARRGGRQAPRRPDDDLAAAVVSAAAAVLASVLVRPDLDDAAYMVRTTWIADRGLVDVGDVIFSDGVWPGLPAQTPYVASFEALAGMTSHVTGVASGTLVYGLYVPLAAFGAVWALWALLRAWRVRWPVLALVLAMVFVCWGGPLNASWGNLHLGRIWQGKVTLLAVLVPLAFAWVAAAVAAPRRERARHLVKVGALGVAAVGLSPAGVFVLPGVLAVGAVGAALVGRWSRGLLLLVAGSVYPLLAGAATVLAGSTGAAGEVAAASALNPWVRTLGTGASAALVLVAAAVALLGLAGRRLAASRSPLGRATAAAAVVAGLVIALPVTNDLLVRVMGTESIAWRAVWVVPVPALVGMLPGAFAALLPERRAVVAIVVGAAAVGSGTPLWSAANHAQIAAPGSWKTAPADLEVARWVVARDAGGRYLAPAVVATAVGTITAGLSPVGTRPGYITAYDDEPGALAEERYALQMWAEGAAGESELVLVPGALDALDVRVVCGAPAMGSLLPGWAVAHQGAAHVCWTRD
jgi:hypothetical protein